MEELKGKICWGKATIKIGDVEVDSHINEVNGLSIDEDKKLDGRFPFGDGQLSMTFNMKSDKRTMQKLRKLCHFRIPRKQKKKIKKKLSKMLGKKVKFSKHDFVTT